MNRIYWKQIAACVLINLSWSSLTYACEDRSSDIKVFLAVPDNRGIITTGGSSHLSVVIMNNSSEPVRLFNASYSFGYYNVKLEWIDAQGNTGIVKPKQIAWNKNIPANTTLLPGEVKIHEIEASDGTWEGWPEGRKPQGIPLTVKAIYEEKADTFFKMDVWCGKAESDPIKLTIYRLPSD